MYYLNARYYNPHWRRFISPDDTGYLDPEPPNGLNLYCYCNNDPINYSDPSGKDPEWWHWVVSGLEVAAGIALCFVPGTQAYGAVLIGMGVGAMISGYLSEANGGSFTAGWLGGQVAGAFSLIPGMGWAAPVVGTFTGSVVTDYVDYGWNGTNWRKAIVTGIIAGAINYSPVLLNGIATDWGVTDATFVLTNAYNGFYTSTASSILNAFWRDNK